jgi:glucan 1,3-beta-glucosidase
MAAIRGVNLGGWLVLEKWMTPELFKGCDAPDEYGFCDQAGRDMQRRLAKHHASYITEQDFIWLAAHGITAVRIPVGYWIFGDVPPYIGAIEYLDKAFSWAAKHGLEVFISLHGAPGSQNGEMHSGRQGSTEWDKDPANIAKTLAAVERLATRYHAAPAFKGIGLLNEPAAGIPRKILRRYYHKAYHAVRRVAGKNVWVLFTDIYHPEQWRWSLRWPWYRNVYLDSHQYQIFTEADRRMSAAAHLTHTQTVVAKQLKHLAKSHPVLVGEWSGALDPTSLQGLSPEAQEQAQKAYIQTQMEIYGKTDGWFFWNYRHDSWPMWSYRTLVERSIIKL